MTITPRLLLTACLALGIPTLAAAAANPGAPAPDFTLAARDGGKVSLAELKGQVVMINFWATWCGPCRQEMPLFAQLQSKYEPLGFTLLAVNVEPDSAAAVNWLKGMPITFPVLFDTDSAVAGRFGVEGMPSTVFVDRQGSVLGWPISVVGGLAFTVGFVLIWLRSRMPP